MAKKRRNAFSIINDLVSHRSLVKLPSLYSYSGVFIYRGTHRGYPFLKTLIVLIIINVYVDNYVNKYIKKHFA